MEERRESLAGIAAMSPEDQARFDRVWQRILPELEPLDLSSRPKGEPRRREESGDGSLTELVRRTRLARERYLRLARGCRRERTARLMKQLAREKELRLRTLMTAEFLRTGQRNWEKPERERSRPFPELLRDAALAELEDAGLLEERAGRAEPWLKELLFQMAREARKNADTLRGLLDREW